MPDAILIEIMTGSGCCLCDAAKEVVNRVLGDYPARLQITAIESDPALLARYREKIPVVLINGAESFVYKVHETTLRKKLEEILRTGI